MWNRGDGYDRISDGQGANVLKLGEGIRPSDLRFGARGRDLQVLIGEGEEEGGVFVGGWFDRNPGRAAPLSEIRFADGSVLSAEEIEAMNIDRSVVLGTSRDDTLGAWEAGEGNHCVGLR